MNRYFLAALFIGFGALLAHTGASGAQENPVTAIDIALEPDATMIQHAKEATHDWLTVKAAPALIARLCIARA